MKSLEIVNKIQNDFNECFSRYDVRTMTIQNPNFYAKEWETIKADLEVLEILKDLFKKNSKEYIGNDFGVMINGVELYMKNKEDFHKVKQWLEENE